jgi:short-subunit dehydrogenase
MHGELRSEGIKSTALCPAFVDTPMTDFVKEQISPEDMIQVSDVAETVRVLLEDVARVHRPGGPVPAAQRRALDVVPSHVVHPGLLGG